MEDVSIPLSDRVAGLVVVMLAQPITRVAALRLTDVQRREDGTVALAFGDDPVALPERVTGLVSAYLEERVVENARGADSPYLFPGLHPGDPMVAAWLTTRLNRLRITRHERQGALTHLLSEVPATVVAKAIGYSPATTAARAATDWQGYAALRSAAAR